MHRERHITVLPPWGRPGSYDPPVYVSRLELTSFRNYRRLGLELDPGETVFSGQNGQGKSNLLEAVYVLATTRSPRTSNERELVSWHRPLVPDTAQAIVPPEGPAFARLEANVQRLHQGLTHLELLFAGQEQVATDEPPAPPSTVQGVSSEVTGRIARTIKVNGVPRRAAELLGHLRVVYFSPEDVALAGGSPAGRRRYLDLANSQVAPLYLRALQQYNRILLQRGHVLRQIRERRQAMAALAPWTDQMVRTGVFVLRHRLQMLAAINERAVEIFQALAGTSVTFRVEYRPTAFESSPEEDESPDSKALTAAFRERQEALAAREVEQAASLAGPHRDDFTFLLDGVDLNRYGSRGQQRLAVLALKLAEAEWMRAETDEVPVLLLDDVLSELDPERRRYVLNRIMPAAAEPGAEDRHQVWITTTDMEAIPPELLARAQRFKIDAGSVRRA